jgi:hypothetical protein
VVRGCLTCLAYCHCFACALQKDTLPGEVRAGLQVEAAHIFEIMLQNLCRRHQLPSPETLGRPWYWGAPIRTLAVAGYIATMLGATVCCHRWSMPRREPLVPETETGKMQPLKACCTLMACKQGSCVRRPARGHTDTSEGAETLV